MTDRGPVSSAGGEARRSQTIFEPATEEAYNFRFAAGKAFREKFERFAEVIGVDYPHKHIERVLDEALEIALEKKDPKRKHERRLKREGCRAQAPRPGEVTEKRDAPGGEERASRATSRYIPSEVRERVLERAGTAASTALRTALAVHREQDWRLSMRGPSRSFRVTRSDPSGSSARATIA